MTVGQCLSQLTGFPLLYNHMLIDLLTTFFEFNSPRFERLINLYAQSLHDEVAASAGSLIATWGWPFERPEAKQQIDAYARPFFEAGGDVWYVELEAPFEERLRRNRHEHRRAHKKLDWATDHALTQLDRQHQYSSNDAFPYPERHLLLDATSAGPEELAMRIAERFELPLRGTE